jgi:hypothetical protein
MYIYISERERECVSERLSARARSFDLYVAIGYISLPHKRALFSQRGALKKEPQEKKKMTETLNFVKILNVSQLFSKIRCEERHFLSPRAREREFDTTKRFNSLSYTWADTNTTTTRKSP